MPVPPTFRFQQPGQTTLPDSRFPIPDSRFPKCSAIIKIITIPTGIAIF
ncbi:MULTISPECIES: hypothetical protein [unclassified Moorena]|nr:MULTISPECIES: hypothetical protein [unclassified Moorena]NEO14999.1 hypothetical protein [Moorena sp. SIO3E8]NEQ03452.1 hypothetical protein [Moorena sp. SIO3F7]